MKMTVIGVTRRYGTSNRTGNKYDMCRLFALTPVTPSSNQTSTFEGSGFQASELDLHVDAFPQFKQLQDKFPLELELTTDNTVRGNNLVTIITGFKQLQPARQAS